MKIVVLDGYTENPGDLSWAPLEAMGELTVYDRTPVDDAAEIARRIGGAEIVFTNKTPIGRAVMDACPGMRYIGVLATGYNVVDIACAAERGIPVTNVPAYGTAIVAQFTIALLLEICHRIGYHSDTVRAGRWAACPDFCYWDYPLIELAGKTMGIIGFGRIGRQVGRIARVLGMEVIACSPSQCGEGREIGTYVSMDELLARSDVISLHCPLFPETRGIIDRGAIAKMKDGVILLNCSRGPLVAEEDLAEALNSGKVYAAGLDVAAVEPIPADDPLLRAKNCFMTPHIAWASRESRQRIMDCAAENLRAYLAGTPVHVVNM